MYCHWVGGGVPPPPTGCSTVRTRRDVTALPCMSVALSRMIDPSQLRFGKGGFTQVVAP